MAVQNEGASAPGEKLCIVVKRQIDAPAERVFDAWIDAETIGKWLFATPTGKMVRVEVEPRVGGNLLVFEQRGDVLAEHYGRYLKIDRPRRLAFLFAVEKFTEPTDSVSRVTVELAPAGGGCEVTLTHEIHPKWAEYADRTRGGWTMTLEKLDTMLSTKGSAMNTGPLVVERILNAPAATVWQAITDENAIKQWFREIEAFQPKIGFEFQFSGTDKGITFLHNCKVTEVVPEKKLAYSWRYDGYEGDSLVTYELFPMGELTRVKLTHAGLDTFPKHGPFVRENFEKGWAALVGELLKAVVEKHGDSSGREIVSSRLFDAPRELVFRAFSDPRHLAVWWGPNGFTNTIDEFDLRPGGVWKITMHAPDGADYRNVSEFIEVESPKWIVYVHQKPMHCFQMAMDFADEAGRTLLTWRMLFETVDDCEKVRSFIVAANEENFDRLAHELQTMKSSGDRS